MSTASNLTLTQPSHTLHIQWDGSVADTDVQAFAAALRLALKAFTHGGVVFQMHLDVSQPPARPGLWVAVARLVLSFTDGSQLHTSQLSVRGAHLATWCDELRPGTVTALCGLTLAGLRLSAHAICDSQHLSIEEVVRALAPSENSILFDAVLAVLCVRRIQNLDGLPGSDVLRHQLLTDAIARCSKRRRGLDADAVVVALVAANTALQEQLSQTRSPTVALDAKAFIDDLLVRHSGPGLLWGPVHADVKKPTWKRRFAPISEDTVQVLWREDRFIEARLELLGDSSIGAEDIVIVPHWATVYRYRDACEAAQAAGSPLPSANTALTHAQRTTLEALEQDWSGTVQSASSRFPRNIRPFIEWNGLRVSCKEAGGVVYCELRGYQNSGPESSFSEHGTEATLLGNRVYFAADDESLPLAVDGERAGRKRLGPNATSLDVAEYNRPAPGPILVREPMPQDVDAARAAFFDDYVQADDADAEGLLSQVRWWAASHPVPLPVEALSVPLSRLRPLIDACVFTVPLGLLHAATTPVGLRTAAAFGVDLNGPPREGGSARNTPLMRHRRDLACFETLLELGADPRTMLDDNGALFRPLAPPQHAAFVAALARHGLTLPTR